jgi:signal transduction histidine kinase
LSQLAARVVAEMQEHAEAQGTKLSCGGDSGPLLAAVDATQIAVALKAIIQNSLEALKQGGEVQVLSTQYSAPGTSENHLRIDQRQSVLPSNPQPATRNPQSAIPNPQSATVLLTVTDTGPGIPPEIRPHIFDPFFSGREAGRGLGLGLSKAWRIVNLHAGTIDVENRPEGGAKFTLALPIE